MLAVSADVLHAELVSVKNIIDKWVEKTGAGIPGVDLPVEGNTPPEERLDTWLAELIGEVRLVSGKTENIAQVLASTLLD
jgi:hypothetical protein